MDPNVCALIPPPGSNPVRSMKPRIPKYGRVRVRARHHLHAIPQNHPKRGTRGPRPAMRGTLILVEVAQLPKHTRVPKQLWLWWHAPEQPLLPLIWRAYVARFMLEHTFRFVIFFHPTASSGIIDKEHFCERRYDSCQPSRPVPLAQQKPTSCVIASSDPMNPEVSAPIRAILRQVLCISGAS